jgi:hypothetical protein
MVVVSLVVAVMVSMMSVRASWVDRAFSAGPRR